MEKTHAWGFKTPSINPEGLVWDKGTLWTVDKNTRTIEQISAETGEKLKSLDIEIDSPRCLAFDGKYFWVSDNSDNTINKFESHEGKIALKIPSPMPQRESPMSIEGLAWDGKHIWMAVYAGWSSSIFQLDSKSGKVNFSFFSQCWPRGLSSDGKFLWSICYNGEKNPSVIDRRTISDKPIEMKKSRKILTKIPMIENPAGLAFDGERLIIVDRATRSIFSLEVKHVG